MSLLHQRLQQNHGNSEPAQRPEDGGGGSRKRHLWLQARETAMRELVKAVDAELLEEMSKEQQEQYISQQVREVLNIVLDDIGLALGKGEYQRLVSEIVSEITGYGPITPLLADPEINEIMVNGPNQVWVEKYGKLELTGVTFRDNDHVMHVIERIVAPLGRRIDESSPMVDARLPDGSRINATIPPVAIDGPALTIRKFSRTPYTVADLIRFGTLSSNMALFLKACVEGRLNIIVAGGTASGKTTTLNVLSSFIPNNERIITIEDAAELQLQQDHVLRMESRAANVEGRGRISIRDLVINSLRMRPDRIVVGEVRGGEALDMLQAMNTGHEGSLTTIHANAPRDMLSRLETMVLMAGMEIPMKAIREQALSALDIIVFQARLKDGTRKILNITEVVGMEGDTITLQDIFVYDQQGVNENGKVYGTFRPTGVMPTFLFNMETKGVHVPTSIFAQEERSSR
ncbi:MAG: CpaF family protein [Syntrophomonadaceae bacterium]